MAVENFLVMNHRFLEGGRGIDSYLEEMYDRDTIFKIFYTTFYAVFVCVCMYTHTFLSHTENTLELRYCNFLSQF